MKKTTTLFGGGRLLIAIMLFVSVSTMFVGCGKDYDGDIKNMNDRIDADKVTADQAFALYKATINAQLAVLEAQDKAQADKLTTVTEQLKDLLAKLTADMKSQATRIGDLESWKAATDKTLAQMSKDITAIDPKLEVIDGRLATLEAGVAKLQGALTVAEDKIKALEAFQATVDAKINAAAAQAVADAKKALEAEAALIRSEMQNVRDRVAAAEAAIKECATKSDFETYKAQVAEQIKAATDPIIAANVKLSEALAGAQGQINLLLGQYKGVVDAQADLKIAFDNLNKAFTAAQTKLAADLLAMSNKIDAIDIRITTEVNNINGAISILDNAITTLTGKVTSIDRTYSAAIDAINVRLDGIDQSILDANALIETKYQAALAEILRQRGEINAEIAEITSTLDDLNAADEKEAQERIKAIRQLYQKLGVEIVKAREAAIDAAKIYTDSVFSGVQALIDAVDVKCADLKTALDALTVRVEKLENEYKTLMGIVEGLINQIQSIVPVADGVESFVNVETKNGITTGKITYIVNTNAADAKLFEDIVRQCDFSFLVNDFTTRVLTDKVFATTDKAKIVVDAAKRTITVPFTMSQITVSVTEPTTTPIKEGLNYSLALQIVDPAAKDNTKTNITSSFVNLLSDVTVALDANDVHFNFKMAGVPGSGDGIFSATPIVYDATTLRDPANNRRGYKMANGEFAFAGVFGVRSYTITDAAYIDLYDVKLVAAYDNYSGASAGYGDDVTARFQILAGTNTLSVVKEVESGQAYTIVVELQAKDVENDATLGAPQYAAFNLSVLSVNDVKSIELTTKSANLQPSISQACAAYQNAPTFNRTLGLSLYNLFTIKCKNAAGVTIPTPKDVALDFSIVWGAKEGVADDDGGVTRAKFAIVDNLTNLSVVKVIDSTLSGNHFLAIKVVTMNGKKAIGDPQYFMVHQQ